MGRRAGQLAEETGIAFPLLIDEQRDAYRAVGLRMANPLHLVRRDHGQAVANRVALRTVVAPWREGGQSQFVEPPPDTLGAATATTRTWPGGWTS